MRERLRRLWHRAVAVVAWCRLLNRLHAAEAKCAAIWPCFDCGNLVHIHHEGAVMEKTDAGYIPRCKWCGAAWIQTRKLEARRERRMKVS